MGNPPAAFRVFRPIVTANLRSSWQPSGDGGSIMSRLFWSERGHVLPTLSEELTTFRRARKILRLPDPSAAEQAVLYLLARPYPGSDRPLRLCINGQEMAALRPGPESWMRWYSTPVPPEALRAGPNTIELWTDSRPPDSWSLGIEYGHAAPSSSLSLDGGRSWQNARMGLHHLAPGEYVVRLRLYGAGFSDPEPPPFIPERRDSPRLAALREELPAAVRSGRSPWEQVRALTAWIAPQWSYTDSTKADLYTPWDPWAIRAWGAAERGHLGMKPIAMCVHYNVLLACAATALGLPVRCAAVTGGVGTGLGHFVVEVWLEEYGLWAMADANTDVMFVDKGRPLSIAECYARRAELRTLAVPGPGAEAQAAILKDWLADTFYTGECFRLRSFWNRMDLLSRPDQTPPGHGQAAYCETNLVWSQANVVGEELGMFPYVVPAERLDQPPGI